jgi:hypothetical protein
MNRIISSVLTASALIFGVFLSKEEAVAQTPTPQTLQSISVIVFPGGFNWPICIAQDKGFFAKDGVEVELTNTPNSVFQLTNLIDGKFDIAITAIDNVVAYMEGQGEVPVSTTPDLFAFMGGDNGLLSLATVPEVKTYRESWWCTGEMGGTEGTQAIRYALAHAVRYPRQGRRVQYPAMCDRRLRALPGPFGCDTALLGA